METRDRLILLVIAAGFAAIALEVRHLHRDVLGDEWVAYVPIVYGALAAVTAFVAAVQPTMQKLAAGVFALGVVAGGAGVYFHSDGEPGAFTVLFSDMIVARANGDEDHLSSEQKESEPPILAPTGIAGLAAIGVIVATRRAPT